MSTGSRCVQSIGSAPFLFGLLIEAWGAASVVVSAGLGVTALAALLALRPAPAPGPRAAQG
jgi:hypothetical protein